MQIKTLAEILAESDTDSASSAVSKSKQRKQTNSKPSSKSGSKPAKLTQTELFHRRKSKKARRSTQQNIKTNCTKNDSNTSFEDKADNTSSIDVSDPHFFSDDLSDPNSLSKSAKRQSKKRANNKKRFHAAATFIAEPNDTPAYEPPEPQSIQQMLAEVKGNVHSTSNNSTSNNAKSRTENDDNQIATNDKGANDATSHGYIDTLTTSEIDNLPSALKAYLRTPEQKQSEIDAIKAESRLRWLAFYYLSRREFGKAELKQKLIDKEQDEDKIDALLEEFSAKGYQSDYRTTLMLIRENIRKGRGRERIKQEFYKKKIAMPSNLDELIDMANSESEEFSEFVDDSADSLVAGVDWLKLAVEARTKKYGNEIPKEQKDKAKQLRFLQYRGFKSDICFQALNYTLETLEERF